MICYNVFLLKKLRCYITECVVKFYFRLTSPSVKERVEFFEDSPIIKDRPMIGITNPFNYLDREQLEMVLEDLGYIAKSKNTMKDMREKLVSFMQGKERPPVLFFNVETIPDKMQHYKIANHEPLHDITGMIQCILEELPQNISSKVLSKEVAKFR